MQYNIVETALQPFIQLAQSNMELLKNFSPIAGLNPNNGQTPFSPGATSSASNLLQANPFVNLIQGAIKNYSEFVMSVGQNSLSLVNQSQANLVRGGQSVAEHVVEVATDARKRRATQEA